MMVDGTVWALFEHGRLVAVYSTQAAAEHVAWVVGEFYGEGVSVREVPVVTALADGPVPTIEAVGL